ncbi:MAG: response regulator [Candidatus Bathyarchaeia archaeon]
METKKTILIIDDDKYIQQVFTRILRKQGYLIDCAETGQEAIEKLQNKKYDLALIDVKLPDTNGTDLISKMHSMHPEMVKIAITGFPSLEDATKTIDRGAAAYLVKPVKSEELIRIINEKLNQ